MTLMTERLAGLRARRTSINPGRRYTTPALWRSMNQSFSSPLSSAKALLEAIAMQARAAEASVSSARKAGATDADAEQLARRYLAELADGLSRRVTTFASSIE